MSSSVSVLAPNGRRQTVKCTPNTTIMQIIEDVCKKQGFEAENYDIKHHNKILDTTSTFRFSGLPNNAQLELAAAVRARVDSEITLAVNLETGNRVMGTFLPDENLWNILQKLCLNDVKVDENPVVIYTRNEIFGDNLRKTTLRSLGLRGGRAMIRLIHKSPDELKTQANVSSVIPSKPVEEKPYHRILKTEPHVSSTGENFESESATEKPAQVQKKNEVDFLKLAREKRKLNDSPAKSSENHQNRPKVEEVHFQDDLMEVDQAQYGKTDTTSEKTVVEEDGREDFVFLGERNAMLFSLESAKTIPSDDLPEDFFELTLDDAKRILNDIKRKRSDMENGTLMTAAMRNLEESKYQLRQLTKYTQAVMRVQFPDRTILQGIFASTDTIKDVCHFVRQYLEDATSDFYIYTTPPKNILSEESKLFEAGCVPGALVHLGTDSQNKYINLRENLRGMFTTNSVASLAASKMRKASKRQGSEEVSSNICDDPVNEMDTAGPSSQPTSYERKVIKSTEKVPKWFKSAK